jgi:hypothetical protein
LSFKILPKILAVPIEDMLDRKSVAHIGGEPLVAVKTKKVAISSIKSEQTNA